MNKTISDQLNVSAEASKYKGAIKEMFAEMKRLNKKMERDQKEIEQMKSETLEILERLNA